MKRYFKETYQVIRVNLRPLLVFELLYRLAAGALYIRMTSLLLGISLRAAGFSYLTMSNFLAFLLRPVTLICAMVLLFLGMILIVGEVGGLITAYQAAAYSRRLDGVSIARGAFGKAGDELRKGNWQILFMSLASYMMINCCFLFRLLTRVKPLNFVMDELLRTPAGRLGLMLLAAGLVLAGIPSMLVFFTCMAERKSFRDGLRRSMALMRGRWPEALVLLLGLNLLLAAALGLARLLSIVAAAVCVRLMAEGYAAMAVLAAACSRIDLVLLAVGSMLAAVMDFGALTVVYFQFEMRSANEPPWDFNELSTDPVNRRRVLAAAGAAAGISLFLIFDMVYNGSTPDISVLARTAITAHRGSSGMAPENTVAALEAAINEMADYGEIDVQTTSDGVVVLCHDLNLKRLAGVNRRVADMTYEEIKGLDVGSSFSPAFAGERIPTLEQVLDRCKGRLKLNIELKNIGDDTGLPEQAAAMIKERQMEEQCVITSVRLSYLNRVKECGGDIRTGYILPAAYGKYYDSDAFDFISIRSSFVNAGMVDLAHARGKAVHVWTVNRRSEMEQMQVLGVDNIITDYPAMAREVLYREEAAETLMGYLKVMLR